MSTLRFAPATILEKSSDSDKILHYGIWVAEDEVIHAMPEQNVTSVSFSDFQGSGKVIRSNLTLRVKSPEAAIARARKEVGGRWEWKLVESNCEAFVLWCATGESMLGNQASAGVIIASALPSDLSEPIAADYGQNMSDIEELHSKATMELAISAAIEGYDRGRKKG